MPTARLVIAARRYAEACRTFGDVLLDSWSDGLDDETSAVIDEALEASNAVADVILAAADLYDLIDRNDA